jgi:hypothetical protein
MEEKIHAPAIGELPSARQLNRATLIAAGVATVLLVTIVLPAEYGVDPVGTGRLLGLTEMGAMKRDAARAAAEPIGADSEDISLDPEPPLTFSAQAGEQNLTLQPRQGREVKATMQAGGEFDYEWKTALRAARRAQGRGERRLQQLRYRRIRRRERQVPGAVRRHPRLVLAQ